MKKANIFGGIKVHANKGSKSATLKISSQGLSHIYFENDSLKSNYYLVEIK